MSPYVLDIALAAILADALLRIPETRPTAPAAAKPAPLIGVPADIQPAFLATAIAGAASFMVVGWVFGLSPFYLHEELHIQISFGLGVVTAWYFDGLALLVTVALVLGRRLVETSADDVTELYIEPDLSTLAATA